MERESDFKADKERSVDRTFYSSNPKVGGKLAHLFHTYMEEAALGNSEVAEIIRKEAAHLKRERGIKS